MVAKVLVGYSVLTLIADGCRSVVFIVSSAVNFIISVCRCISGLQYDCKGMVQFFWWWAAADSCARCGYLQVL